MRPGYTNRLTLVKRDLSGYEIDSNGVLMIVTDITIISSDLHVNILSVAKDSPTVCSRCIDGSDSEFVSGPYKLCKPKLC